MMFVLLGLLLLASCGDNDPSSPGPAQTSGTATLASTYTGDGFFAFSFEKGEVFVDRSGTGLTTQVIISDGDDLRGVFFGSNSDSGFALVASHDTYEAALSAFAALEQPSDLEYERLAIPLLPNQVWLVRTYDGKWAKVLIIDADPARGETNTGQQTMFGVVTFHWVYQPDGSKTFDAGF